MQQYVGVREGDTQKVCHRRLRLREGPLPERMGLLVDWFSRG